MIEIDSIQYNLQSEFHMLRHFEKAENEILRNLFLEGYSIQEIQNELSLPGSKFFSHFANDISELIEKIVPHIIQKSVGINGNHIIESDIPLEQFPNGIGTKAVVALKDITPEFQSKIFFEKNRNYSLSHFLVDKLPITNRCTLILKPVTDGYIFISAFSGESAMPIPKNDMPTEIFNACAAYWSEHVFLKLRL